MVTFEQFVETCLSEVVDEENPVEKINGQLTALKTKYEKSPIWKNKALEQILAHYDHSIKSEADKNGKQLVYYDFREEFKRLDKYLNTLKSKDKKERAKLMKKIKDLQTRIKKDLRKIDRLDQSEISIDDLDNENSDHMKKQKYEQRVKRFSNKLLRLQGAKESARLLDQVYKYTGTEYPELNESISTKYRAIMQKKYKGKIPQRPMNSTPSIADITELIDKFCTEKNIPIADKAELALKITGDIINEVQRRRVLEVLEMMNDYEHDSHLRPDSVPDLADEELNKRLISNEEKGRDSFIKKREELKKKLDSVEAGDIGGEEGTASEEEEDDDDDMLEDGLDEDEDEEISEDEVMETNEANPEDDEDDDPILLDEAGPTVNGNIKAAETSSSNDNKKRSLDTNGTETNGDEPSKKIKVTESQLESNSEKKEEISSIEKNGEVEMKEEPKNEPKEEPKEEKIEITEKTKEEKDEPIEDQSTKISTELKEEEKKEEVKKEESTTINDQPENAQSSSAKVETDEPKSEAIKSEKVETDSNQLKTNKSEVDNNIKIVDLEEENRTMDDQSNVDDDDDDVICLD